MRIVYYTDKNGWLRPTKIRDSDPDDMAKTGIPIDTIDISALVDDVKKDIHNSLVQQGIFGYNDVVMSQNGVTSIITSAIRRKIITAFKLVKEA